MDRLFGRFVLLVIVGLLSFTPHTVGQNQQITVSVFSDVRIPRQILVRSEKEASLIYAQGGIDVHFLDCVHSIDVAICDRGYESGDLAVRITSHTSRLVSDSAFGVAWLDDKGRGSYADIFWNRALELCMNSRIDLGTILGYVIAHEVGHLLLGANSHTATGIMRAHWGPAELRSIGEGKLAFLPSEMKIVQSRLFAPKLVLSSRRGNTLSVEP